MSKLSLDRVLQSQGFGTRKYCRALIEDGDVAINGAIHDNYKTPIETDGLVLTVFDEEWTYREHVYIALYKPSNFECSRKPSHHPGVLTLLPEQFTWRDVQPVGRLDHDTTGLLLMSDDGPFIHAQSSPKRHIPKVYQATTQEPVTQALARELATRERAGDADAGGRLDEVLARLVEACRVVAVELSPFVPDGAARLREQLGSPQGTEAAGPDRVGTPTPVFPRLG